MNHSRIHFDHEKLIASLLIGLGKSVAPNRPREETTLYQSSGGDEEQEQDQDQESRKTLTTPFH